MQAVVLAGGLGTRLGRLTENTPKSMVEIGGKPFISYQLEHLKANGFDTVVLCVGYRAKTIERFVGDGRDFKLSVKYSNDGKNLLGTAGCLRKALGLLEPCFMVLNGDSFLPVSLARPFKFFERTSDRAMMMVYRNNNKYDRSNVRIRDSKVLGYERFAITGSLNYIDYGATFMRRAVLAMIPRGYTQLDLLYKKLIAVNQLSAYVVWRRFYEVGSTKGIIEFGRYLMRKKDN